MDQVDWQPRFVINAGKSLAIIHFELPDLIFVNKNYATAVFEAKKFCQIAEFNNCYEVLKNIQRKARVGSLSYL